MHPCVLSHFICVSLFATPWTVALQGPCSSPGKNTGADYRGLLQGIFLAQGLNPRLLHLLHWQESSLLTQKDRNSDINICTNIPPKIHFSVASLDTVLTLNAFSRRKRPPFLFLIHMFMVLHISEKLVTEFWNLQDYLKILIFKRHQVRKPGS